MVADFTLHEQKGIIHQLPHVQWYELKIRFAAERANALDHVAGAATVADHANEGLVNLPQVRIGPLQKPQGRLAIGCDCRKWLIDFVDDRSRQLAQRRYARHVGKLGLRLAQRALRFTALNLGGDVAAYAAVSKKLPPFVEDGPTACLDVHGRAVWPPQTVDEITKWLAQLVRRNMSHPFLSFRPLVDTKVPTSLSDARLGLDAGNFEVVGDACELVVRSGLPQPVRSGLGKVAKALFAVASFLFRALALRIFASQRRIGLREFPDGAVELVTRTPQ